MDDFRTHFHLTPGGDLLADLELVVTCDIYGVHGFSHRKYQAVKEYGTFAELKASPLWDQMCQEARIDMESKIADLMERKSK